MVYEIPCTGCYKTYVGETGRGVDVRLKEHHSDVKFHCTSNAAVLHIEECHHLPDWNKTKAAFCAKHSRLHPLNIPSTMPRHGRVQAKRSGNPLSSGLFGWWLSIQRSSACMVRTGQLFLHNGHTQLNAKYKLTMLRTLRRQCQT